MRNDNDYREKEGGASDEEDITYGSNVSFSSPPSNYVDMDVDYRCHHTPFVPPLRYHPSC